MHQWIPLCVAALSLNAVVAHEQRQLRFTKARRAVLQKNLWTTSAYAAPRDKKKPYVFSVE